MGLEVYEQVPKLDAVIFPAGGHCGLLAGSAAALKHLNPNISVIVSFLSFVKCGILTAFTDIFKRHWYLVTRWQRLRVLGTRTTCAPGLHQGEESLGSFVFFGCLAGFKKKMCEGSSKANEIPFCALK